MRKKEEIDRQIEKISAKTTPAVTISARSEAVTPTPVEKENNDFDVEEYEYTPEEYSYQHVSAYHASESVIKPEKPYYIPLTDVPYPGEVSSEFDLKRFVWVLWYRSQHIKLPQSDFIVIAEGSYRIMILLLCWRLYIHGFIHIPVLLKQQYLYFSDYSKGTIVSTAI